MNVSALKKLLYDSAELLKGKEDYLCAIDAETGDGDCGVAVARICSAIMEACSGDTAEDATVGDLMSDISMKIMGLNGGSSVPLWAMLFDGMSDASEDMTEVDDAGVKALLEGALDGIQTVSNAKVGEKTMMDAIIPAVEAAKAASANVLDAAADAAAAGAEATKDMVAKFGRAKNLLEDSKGHYDAGALAVSILVNAIRDNSKK